MIAIDEFRRMLDERGIEWKAKAFYFMDVGTVFSTSSDFEWIAIWDKNANNLSITNYKNGLTPTQVIAATLGEDECTIERNVDGSYKCPKCGCVVDYDIRGDDERIITMDDYVIPFNFCPKCGAEVVTL